MAKSPIETKNNNVRLMINNIEERYARQRTIADSDIQFQRTPAVRKRVQSSERIMHIQQLLMKNKEQTHYRSDLCLEINSENANRTKRLGNIIKVCHFGDCCARKSEIIIALILFSSTNIIKQIITLICTYF